MTKAIDVIVVDEKVVDVIGTTPIGPPGIGVPIGGDPGQILVKSGDDDFETEWSYGSDIDGGDAYSEDTTELDCGDAYS